MTLRQMLAKVRVFLRSPDLDAILQGIELVETLDDPELTAAACGGVSIDGEGRVSWSRDSEVARRIFPDHQTVVALELLRISGALAEIEQISLRVGGGGRLAHFVRHLSNLRSLALRFDRQSTDLSSLQGLPRLAHVTLEGNWRPGAVGAPLASLPALESLLLYQIAPADPGFWYGVSGVRRLELRRLKDLRGLRHLGALSALEALSVDYTWRLGALSALAGLTGLQTLRFSNCTRIWDLGPLVALDRLESLALETCPRVEDYSALARLPALRELTIRKAGRRLTLAPLSGHAGLRRLTVEGNHPRELLAPLADTPGLEHLALQGFEDAGIDGTYEGRDAIAALLA